MLTPAQNSLDATRAALCSLSWITAREVAPVHTLRLGHLARAINPAADVLESLKSINELGEACRFPNGYWLPVRPSIVLLIASDKALIIAPNPISELQRRLADCTYTLGFSRSCDLKGAPSWPRQTLDQWMRQPTDLRGWTEHWLKYHRSQLKPTSGDETRLEYYSGHPWSPQNSRRWLPLSERSTGAPRAKPLLMRERAGSVTLRHMIGTCRGKTLEAECQIECDSIRLQFGIEMLEGATTKLVAQRVEGELKFRLPRALPKEEQTLIAALCRVSQFDRFAELTVPRYGEASCLRSLASLGIEIEVRNV